MKLRIFTSTVNDGSMKSLDGDYETARSKRIAFLQKCKLEPRDSTLHTLSYGGDDYCRYRTIASIDKGDGIMRDSTIDADAVTVTESGHAILLPLADCIGAVIYDQDKQVLMVSHLGRHNLEQSGGTKCINYLANRHGVNPSAVTVWLSPSAGKENYPLYAFNGRGLSDVATEQLIAAGVLSSNISRSPIDSSSDSQYFSHSQYLKGNHDIDGRFGIVAIMQ